MNDIIEYTAVIEVKDVEGVLKKHNIDESLQQIILSDLSSIAEKTIENVKSNITEENLTNKEEKEEEKNSEPKVKKDYIILVSDPNEKIKCQDEEGGFEERDLLQVRS